MPDFSNPMIFGAVGNTTAELLARSGAALSDQIEKQNLQADAAMKAPVIASAVGQAMTRLSQGDSSGFSLLAKATSAGASNPILQSMYKDADGVAAKLFDSYMDAKTADARLQASDAMETRREAARAASTQTLYDHQNQAAADRDTANAGRQTDLYNRQVEREDELLYRQQLGDWQKNKDTIDKEYVGETNKVQQANAAEQRRAQLEPGYTPNLQPPPTKPAYPAEPQRRTRTPVPDGAQPLPGVQLDGGTGSLFDVSAGDTPLPPLPTNISSANKDAIRQVEAPQAAVVPQVVGDTSNAVVPAIVNDNAGAVAGTGAQPAPVQAGTPAPAAPAPAAAPASAPAAVQPPPVAPAPVTKDTFLKKQDYQRPIPKGAVERQVGNVAFLVPGYDDRAQGGKVSETIKTGTGSVTIDTSKEAKPANQLADALATVNGQDPQFGTWLSTQLLTGNQVYLTEQKTKDGEKWTPYAKTKDNQSIPWYDPKDAKSDANGVQSGSTRDITNPEVAKAFNTAVTLMQGPMKGKFAMYQTTTDDRKHQARVQAIMQVEAGNIKLDDANSQLNYIGAAPIGAKEIDWLREIYRTGKSDFTKLTGIKNPAMQKQFLENEAARYAKDKLQERTSQIPSSANDYSLDKTTSVLPSQMPAFRTGASDATE